MNTPPPVTIAALAKCSRCNFVTADEERMHEHILSRACQNGATYYTIER